jgi:DMSO/TMAO reductase YedYZ heme-binding membrane subunit
MKARSWLPAVAVLVVHVVLWKGTAAYDQIPTLDRATHFLGGVAATWFLLCCMREPWGGALFGKHSQLSEALCLLAWAGLTVVAWEFLEWTLDAIGLTRSQRSIDDTISDLAFGILGGILVIMATRRSPRA